MRLIKWLIGVVAAVLILASLGSFLLPGELTVTRSVVIKAEPAEVFAQVNRLKAFQEWLPWSAKDPNMVRTYDGPDDGKGAKMTWDSDNPQVGSGAMEITESVVDKHVAYKLDFGEQGQAKSWFDIAKDAEGTKLTWGFHTIFGRNPAMRYMGLLMDEWIGKDYEVGLAELKKRLEAKPTASE